MLKSDTYLKEHKPEKFDELLELIALIFQRNASLSEIKIFLIGMDLVPQKGFFDVNDIFDRLPISKSRIWYLLESMIRKRLIFVKVKPVKGRNGDVAKYSLISYKQRYR